MTLDELLTQITPEIYETLQQAVAIGRWPDGARLDDEQRALCLQAVIAWGEHNLTPEQRVGHIPARPHPHCGGSGDEANDAPRPVQWRS